MRHGADTFEKTRRERRLVPLHQLPRPRQLLPHLAALNARLVLRVRATSDSAITSAVAITPTDASPLSPQSGPVIQSATEALRKARDTIIRDGFRRWVL